MKKKVLTKRRVFWCFVVVVVLKSRRRGTARSGENAFMVLYNNRVVIAR